MQKSDSDRAQSYRGRTYDLTEFSYSCYAIMQDLVETMEKEWIDLSTWSCATAAAD
jgi:hypothetical protein